MFTNATGCLAAEKIENRCPDVLEHGGHLGLRAAQGCRSRVGSATALRSKMPSPLTNVRSLSPETVRRGENKIVAHISCYVAQTRQRHELCAGYLGSSLPCWIVERIGTSGINKRRHSDCAHHVGKSLGDQPLLRAGNQSGGVIGPEALTKGRCQL